jgi:hypothetical protein
LPVWRSTMRISAKLTTTWRINTSMYMVFVRPSLSLCGLFPGGQPP